MLNFNMPENHFFRIDYIRPGGSSAALTRAMLPFLFHHKEAHKNEKTVTQRNTLQKLTV